ncbi:transcriptional regulator with XRE-family HTH domain [Clostridium butyricum]|nr:helix-turn-helix domain-containing protein [Clostridium butyricum]MBA8973112.1 transcriptional regulator with XRE-family HTH domain [Clostridium butyricum]
MKGKLYYKLIKDKRNELDITQKQICDELNIQLEEYKKMESGDFIPKRVH